ncbi:MAG: phosphate signaling complex protein PhoU [Methanosarcinales archaeon]|nr:phosphate signaling complex protein PhoU [Methanosarcinales archaeon]
MVNIDKKDIDNIIQEIIKDIREMGLCIKTSIDRSVTSLKEQNTSMADKVIENKKRIDELGDVIEDKCTKTMTMKVSSSQLRMLKGALKMIIDLGNIQDLAIEIAFITKATANAPHIKPLVDIPRMSDLLQEMLDSSLDALEKQDADLARITASRDDEVDALFDQIRRELITYMIEDPQKIANASHLTFAARYLERMGDHINNLCESVVYIVTGLKEDLN